MSLRIRPALGPVALLLLLGCAFAWPARPLAQDSAARSFSVVAKRYAFAPGHIEVFEGDVVQIDLHTEDIAHSLTIDEYRVAKRVSPGQTVTFEFRAERAGTFPFYCDLKVEDGCREMHGELVVKPRR